MRRSSIGCSPHASATKPTRGHTVASDLGRVGLSSPATKTRVATAEGIDEVFAEEAGEEALQSAITPAIRLAVAEKRKAALERKEKKKIELKQAIPARKSNTQAKKYGMLREHANKDQLKRLRSQRSQRAADLRLKRPRLSALVEGPTLAELDAKIRKVGEASDLAVDSSIVPETGSPAPQQQAQSGHHQGWNPESTDCWQLGSSQNTGDNDEPSAEATTPCLLMMPLLGLRRAPRPATAKMEKSDKKNSTGRPKRKGRSGRRPAPIWRLS